MDDRDERRERVADAYYELWRKGRNPDSLNPDRAYDMAYDHTGEEIARAHIRRQDEQRHQREYEEAQESERQYYEAQQAREEQEEQP